MNNPAKIIPKFIYQTHKYKEGEFPPGMQEAMNKIKSVNKNYVYEYYDDDKADKFMRESFGEDSEEYWAFNCFVNPAFKADFFRYAIVKTKKIKNKKNKI